MWAYENNVYVFSAGAISTSAGSGGSGLYVGKLQFYTLNFL